MEAETKQQKPKGSSESKAFELSRRENGVAFLKFDLKNQKVNILATPVMMELNQVLDELSNRTDIKALVILSGKEDNFIAGADVSEIDDITDPEDGAEKARLGQGIFQKIHELPFPVVAAIQGACVGGGLELALACHFRIAKIHPKTKIGLPEVQLGILPGFGGTQRLPRLIGIQRALKLILTGRQVNAKYAGKLGIVDKVLPVDYPFSFMRAAAEEFALDMSGKFKRNAYEKKRNAKRLHALLLESNALGRRFIFKKARERTLKNTKGHYPAPLKALESVQKGFEVSLKKGLEIEAQLLGELITTDVSKNLISIYYLREELKKDSGVEKPKSEPKEIRQTGLLGAGLMGGGIAQLFAYHDLPVRMKDIDQEPLDAGMKKARQVFEKAVEKKKLKRSEMQRKMTLISGTTEYSGFNNVDLVVEAVVEKMDVKQQVFAEIEKHVPEDAILATNTSSLSISEIATAVKKPGRVIGFHFFNPVHRMPLVEVIRGEKTSDETTISAVAFAKKIGKTPIVVKNSPGFLVNRILAPYINEGAVILEEGGNIEDIDKAMVDFGMPMGPLNLLDEVGIDVGYKVSKILENAFGERVKASQVIERLNDDGRLGKKGDKGFYIYEDKDKRVDPAVYNLIADLRKSEKLSKKVIQDRLVFIMLKEAVLCLQEEIVRYPRDVDAGLIFGTGFPPFRGGLLRYADRLGLENCVEHLQGLREKYGDRFEAPDLLTKMAKSGSRFYDE